MSSYLPAVDPVALADLCRRYGIIRLARFGSAARGELNPDSDIDILVEFQAGQRVGLRFITLQDELTGLLGRTVDLCTPAFLSPHLRRRVLAESLPIYEAARRPGVAVFGKLPRCSGEKPVYSR